MSDGGNTTLNDNWRRKTLRRAHWLAAIVLLLAAGLLVGLLGRVAWIERHVTGEDVQRLDRQHDAGQKIMADRGSIRLTDGTVVATSVRMFNLFADPAFIVDPGGQLKDLQEQKAKLEAVAGGEGGPGAVGAVAAERDKLRRQIEQLETQMDTNEQQVEAAKQALAEALAPLLNRTPGDVRKLIQENIAYPAGRPRRFLWLAREVDDAFHARFLEAHDKLKQQAAEITRGIRDVKEKDARETARAKAEVLAHALDGVGFVESVKRQYPLGPVASEVVGFANNDGGVDGMEKQLDPLLQGRWGEVMLLKDAQRRTLMTEDKDYRPAEHGCTVWLTLDPMMQSIVEEELAKACLEHQAESGCAIILDPRTGRILAMANWPTFDPGNYQAATAAARTNRCIVDPYEPGSIFKPFIASVAIENHVVRPTDVFDCHYGRWNDPTGRVVTDTHGGYGALTVEDILVHSSNIGMTQIGWKMGKEMVYDAVTRFGFGGRTGVELPGDGKGLVKPFNKWNYGTLTSVSFGYEVAATPLQLVRAYATFANGGYLVTPRIMHAVEVAPGKTMAWEDLAGPPVQRQIISAETCEKMRNIMAGVFLRGTAKSTGSKIYRLYGKTGTAHLAIQGQGHYDEHNYNSSFLAGGPMSEGANGRGLVAVVTLHKPDPKYGHFGGIVAAPACCGMLERALQYLQVPGDQVESVKREVAAE